MTATQTEIAWAAGLFEGEGTFLARRKETSRPDWVGVVAGLGMTDEDVVLRFARIVGVGHVSGPHTRPPHKPIWRWHASSAHEVRQVVEMFLPYLGERRRQQAEAMLVARDAYEAGSTHHNTGRKLVGVAR